MLVTQKRTGTSVTGPSAAGFRAGRLSRKSYSPSTSPTSAGRKTGCSYPPTTPKNKRFLDEDFDLDVSWYTMDDLLNLAFDPKALSKLDKGDTFNIIRELAIRLQRANDEISRLAR
jgi:hypothetical protein